MRSLPRVSIALAVSIGTAAAMVGCPNPALPPGANISCESNAGCPPETICGGPLQRCVPDTGDDDPPGLVGTPEVSPKRGTKDTTFAITIVADEPLGRPPTVIARGGGDDEAGENGGDGAGEALIGLPPFRLVSDVEGNGGDRRTYRYEYTAAGNEPEGVAIIGVELVDESGRVSEHATDSFVLDFAPPQLIISSIDGGLAKVGTLITVSLTFDEPLDPEFLPEAFLPGSFEETFDILFAPEATVGQTQTFTYRATGNEAEVARPVFVTVYDQAGNVIPGIEGSGAFETTLLVTFDFTPPQPGNSTMDGTPHGANELITASIDFNEVLATEVFVGGDLGFDGAPTVRGVLRGGDPEIDVVFLDVIHSRQVDDFGAEMTRLILQHRVRECDLEGIYDIVLDDVIDAAGNEADGVRGPWQFELADVACE